MPWPFDGDDNIFSLNQILNPLGEEQYKVVTHQLRLNQLFRENLLPNLPSLKMLKLMLTRGTLHIRGIIKEPEHIRKKYHIKLGDIFFDITLHKEEIIRDEVFLRVGKFKVFNPKKRFDLVKIINRHSTTIQEKILEGFTGPKSPFFIEDPLKKIKFDLKWVLNRIPTEANLLGRVQILNVGFEPRRIVWYLQSNLMLRTILDYYGPDYIEVQKVDLNIDALRLLTDFPFDML